MSTRREEEELRTRVNTLEAQLNEAIPILRDAYTHGITVTSWIYDPISDGKGINYTVTNNIFRRENMLLGSIDDFARRWNIQLPRPIYNP